MARSPGFAGVNGYRSTIRIEVRDLESGQLAIPAACGQRGLQQLAEVALCGVNQPLALCDCQISRPRCIHALKKLDTSPRCIAWRSPIAPSTVQGGLENPQEPVRCDLSSADPIGAVVARPILLLAAKLGTGAGRHFCQIGMPLANSFSRERLHFNAP